MTGLLYLIAIIAVLWLAIWVVRDPADLGKGAKRAGKPAWSPFDFTTPPPAADPATAEPPGRNWRSRAQSANKHARRL
ncbi:MAG: hypothetical protein B7Z78_10470 [Rhodospirillales bacterium 20-60-12]|nr:MAG: hypothetical protein B7Z78_10470 [Rhodospirillales bacterium 20-60-12]HQT68298.1 hypothetical protein [Acetobacteraceae bacterium]HQU01581.1 hypothetical protein [Acetobacteraceae bacterium]